jgi:hypothetical protein
MERKAKMGHAALALAVSGLLLMVLAGCAGAPPPAKTNEAVGITPQEANTVTKPTRQVILDWSDRSMGQEENPAWLKPLIINKNPAPFRQAMGLTNDTIVKYAVFTNRNRNVAGTVALVQFNAQIARELKTAVLARAAAILDRGEFDATNDAVLEAKVTLTGLSTAAEFWQLVETENLETRQKEQNYVYYIVYTIRPDIWDGITAKYLLDVVGKIPDSKTQQKAASMLNELKEDTKREQERSDAEFQLELAAREKAIDAQLAADVKAQDAQIARDERTDRTAERTQIAQINQQTAQNRNQAQTAQTQIVASSVENSATQQAALRSGDPVQIAAATTTTDDTDYVAALRTAAGVIF